MTHLFIGLLRISQMTIFIVKRNVSYCCSRNMVPNIISSFSFFIPRQKTCHNFGALKISEKELHFSKLQCSECICVKFGECVLSSPKTTYFRPPLGRLLRSEYFFHPVLVKYFFFSSYRNRKRIINSLQSSAIFRDC